MFTELCSTEGCTEPVLDFMDKCAACYDRNGYPEGHSRSRDDDWLAGGKCEVWSADPAVNPLRRFPLPGPWCSSHPVTPRPDVCVACAELGQVRA